MTTMITARSVTELPDELVSIILNNLDYWTLLKISSINLRLNKIIYTFFEAIVYRARKIYLKKLSGKSLLERIYSLNGYMNGSTCGIIVYEKNLGKMVDGKWNLVSEDSFDGPWRGSVNGCNINDKFISWYRAGLLQEITGQQILAGIEMVVNGMSVGIRRKK